MDKVGLPGELVLASQSPRRKSLLSNTGLTFRVVPAMLEEPAFRTGQDPQEYAKRLALLKAELVARQFPDNWIIGGDTIVVVSDQVLGKPASEADACEMLTLLGGKTHEVMTGCAIISERHRERYLSTTVTQVTFKTLSPQEIGWYIASGEPFGKAGAYAIQGLGSRLVRRINGSYTNVVGLPICEVIEFLGTIGITPFSWKNDNPLSFRGDDDNC